MNFPVDNLCVLASGRSGGTRPHPYPQAGVWILGIGASITRVQRIFPGPQVGVDPIDLYRTIDQVRPADRPWVELCMVASIDGTTSVAGRSTGLGGPSDLAVLAALRERADVIIVGSATAHTERYRAPRKAGQRIGVVTATGQVDVNLPLFESGAGFLITTAAAPSHGLPALRSSGDTVDLAAAIAALDADLVHAEGGPTLNAALLHADLVDEVNLTVAPHLVGGPGQRLASPSGTEMLRRMELVQVCTDDGYLFLRYVRTAQLGNTTR